MAEEKNMALVPSYFGAIKKTEQGPSQILSTMVAHSLALAKTGGFSVAPIRHYISGVELHDPDYQQILLWSQELGMAPENVLQILTSSIYYGDDIEVHFKIQDCTIRSLVIDFDLLPLLSLKWVDGVGLETLSFNGKPISPLEKLSLQEISAYPLISYTAPHAGRASMEKAFDAVGVKIDIAVTAGDSDIVKTCGVIVKSSVWQAVKRLSVLACQSLPHHLQI